MGEYLTKLNCDFYYGLLGIDEQTIFKVIGRAVCEHLECVKISECDKKMLRKILTAIKYDNPELFYWNQDGSEYVEGILRLQYRTKEKSDAEALLKAVRAERKHIIETCTAGGKKSSLELFAAIYQYLVDHTEYAYEELQVPQKCKWIYEMDGALLKRRAVCLGISQTLNYFCEALHLKCLLITGEVTFGADTVNHAWNMVKCGEVFRHFDVTADLCEQTGKKYFMCAEQNLVDRKWARNVYPKG